MSAPLLPGRYAAPGQLDVHCFGDLHRCDRLQDDFPPCDSLLRDFRSHDFQLYEFPLRDSLPDDSRLRDSQRYDFPLRDFFPDDSRRRDSLPDDFPLRDFLFFGSPRLRGGRHLLAPPVRLGIAVSELLYVLVIHHVVSFSDVPQPFDDPSRDAQVHQHRDACHERHNHDISGRVFGAFRRDSARADYADACVTQYRGDVCIAICSAHRVGRRRVDGGGDIGTTAESPNSHSGCRSNHQSSNGNTVDVPTDE